MAKKRITTNMNFFKADKDLTKLRNQLDLRPIICQAFKEDIRAGDLTTARIVPETMRSCAQWIAKEEGVAAGLFAGKTVFKMLDDELKWNPKVEEGAHVEAGDVLVEMEAQSRALLTAERTALNVVQRISGIATVTQRYVSKLQGGHSRILDTRKTMPGFRALDKYGVAAGGGINHRMGLYDMVLIKDNHITIAGSITKAVRLARQGTPEVAIEVETDTLDQVKEAVASAVDIILLDNMDIADLKKAVAWIDGRVTTEASGNVTLERIKKIAATGVDFISVGALTHSVPAFDISQLIL